MELSERKNSLVVERKGKTQRVRRTVNVAWLTKCKLVGGNPEGGTGPIGQGRDSKAPLWNAECGDKETPVQRCLEGSRVHRKKLRLRLEPDLGITSKQMENRSQKWKRMCTG